MSRACRRIGCLHLASVQGPCRRQDPPIEGTIATDATWQHNGALTGAPHEPACGLRLAGYSVDVRKAPPTTVRSLGHVIARSTPGRRPHTLAAHCTGAARTKRRGHWTGIQPWTLSAAEAVVEPGRSSYRMARSGYTGLLYSTACAGGRACVGLAQPRSLAARARLERGAEIMINVSTYRDHLAFNLHTSQLTVNNTQKNTQTHDTEHTRALYTTRAVLPTAA